MGKHFVPSLGLEVEIKKLWEIQVMIPYSFAEKSLAFVGPIRTNPLLESFSFFQRTEEEILVIHDDIIRMDFMKDGKKIFHSNPSSDRTHYISWLERLETNYVEH